MNKCYSWDEELNICLIWGCLCDQKEEYECFHKNLDEFKKLMEKNNV